MGAMGQAITEHFGHREIPKVKVHGRTDRGIIRELFESLNIDADADLSGFLQTYCDLLRTSLAKNEGEILPGVISVLEKLNAHPNVALGILTGNAMLPAEVKLDHFELSEYFLFGGYGDNHSDRNDVASQAVKAARSFLGSRYFPEKTWVIGDTANDIRCARSIGAKVLAVETGGDSKEELANHEPDLLWQDLSNHEPWLDSLCL